VPDLPTRDVTGSLTPGDGTGLGSCAGALNDRTPDGAQSIESQTAIVNEFCTELPLMSSM